MHSKIKAAASNGRNVSIYGKNGKMHLLSILPDQRTGNAAITTSTSSMLIFWLAFEGLLHERKLLLHPPSSFWISFIAGTSFTHADKQRNCNTSHDSFFRRYDTKHLHLCFGSLLESKLNPLLSFGSISQ